MHARRSLAITACPGLCLIFPQRAHKCQNPRLLPRLEQRVTQEIPQETTPSVDPITELQADVAAYESIFAELTRAMDPAALLKVLTYLGRNAKREASENQTYDSLEHRRLVARIDALMVQVQPEARKQAISQRNEQNHLRKQRAKHQADSKRQREGKR